MAGLRTWCPQVLDEETVLSYTRDIPPSMLKECFLTGTPDDVIDQFADWRDQGVRYPVVCNISGLQPSLRKGMAASIPLTRILPWPPQAPKWTAHAR